MGDKALFSNKRTTQVRSRKTASRETSTLAATADGGGATPGGNVGLSHEIDALRLRNTRLRNLLIEVKLQILKQERELEEYRAMLRQEPENISSSDSFSRMWSSMFEGIISNDLSSTSKTPSPKGEGLSQNQLCQRFN